MLSFCHSENLPYSQDHLFSLITDVESYPQFLPWCQQCTVTHRTEQSLWADMTVGMEGLYQTFSSEVTLSPPHQVTAAAQGGLFRNMKTEWKLSPLKNAKEEPLTQILFLVEFTLYSSFLSLLIKPGFSATCHKMVKAFCTRAQNLSLRY